MASKCTAVVVVNRGRPGQDGVPGGVTTFEGRDGAVVSAVGDYEIAEITGLTTAGAGNLYLDDTGTYSAPAGTGGQGLWGPADVVAPGAGDTSVKSTLDLSLVSRMQVVIEWGETANAAELQAVFDAADADTLYWSQLVEQVSNTALPVVQLVNRPMLYPATTGTSWNRMLLDVNLFSWGANQNATIQGSIISGNTAVVTKDSGTINVNRDSVAAGNVIANLDGFRIKHGDDSGFTDGQWRVTFIPFDYTPPVVSDLQYFLTESGLSAIDAENVANGHLLLEASP